MTPIISLTQVFFFFDLVLIIPFLVAVSAESDPDSLTFHDPNTCNKYQNRTFSAITLSCVNCHSDKDKNRGLYSTCSCPSGYVLAFINTEEKIPTKTKCIQCPEDMITFDHRHCIACANKGKPDELTGKCDACPEGHILVTDERDGRPKKMAECLRCSDGWTPGPSGDECVPCHPSFLKAVNGTCKCPSTHSNINGICFPNTEISEAPIDRNSLFKMEYETGPAVDSKFLKDNLQSAFYLCKIQHNVTACELLANMCTLQMHSNDGETNACSLYKQVAGDSYHNPPPYVPKLYYLSIEAQSLLMRGSSIPLQFGTNLAASSSDFNITVSRVSVDGKFLGLSMLNEMIPCAEPARVQRFGRKFGTTYRSACDIPVQDLWNKYSPVEFLDPYLSVRDNKEMKLYPIPVRILNFKQQGVRINELDMNHQWQLVRRFFFVDTVDSIESAVKEDGQFKSSKQIRYLERIHIGIQLQNSYDPGKVYLPLITLSYRELDLDSYRRNVVAPFEFKVEYTMDMSKSLEDVKISVGVISSLTVLWAAIQAWSWNRRSGRPYIDLTTMANLLIYTCGHLADAFFVVCFGTSLFWFIFYKKQAAVHILLPQPEQERLIRDLLISAFSLKIIEVLNMLYRQVDIDIFFIDWERPKARNVIPSPPVGSKSAGSAKMSESGNNNSENSEGNVSIWRTYFIANEWNEIQSVRKVHLASQIIVTLFMLEIVGLKYWGLLWPDTGTNPGPEHRNIPYSTSARFAVGSSVFLIIGTLQWIFRVGIYERFISNKIQDFVDVCTLANVSVFILAANQYGYYIHGRSVHGFSDTSMQTMIEQLNREEEDLCGRRGLLPSTDQQTFLVSVPSTFRSVYNQVLQPLYASTTANLNMGRGRAQLAGIASKIQMNSKPTQTMLNLSVHAYHSMNRFLTAFLEHALSDLDYDVQDKSFFEATFDMEFGDVTQDRAIFYTDNGHSFDSVLFYGNERTLFLFDLYIFVFVEILSHNFLLAGIITYFADLGLKYMRNHLGKRNLARKTLIDARFLI